MPEKAKRRDTAALIATEFADVDKPPTAYDLLERLLSGAPARIDFMSQITVNHQRGQGCRACRS